MPAVAPALSDPVPGNIGLVSDADTVILLPFTEPTGVFPSDQAGTLEDLEAANVLIPTVDSSVAWASAVSRNFVGRAFLASDKSGKSSLLQRDVSVQAILAFSEATDPSPWSIICRGRGVGVGASEFVAFGVDVVAQFAAQWYLQFHWMKNDGTAETVASSYFTPPPLNTPTLMTWTRRWVSSTSVVCRFYVGDQLVSENTSIVGDIGGGTSGQTSVGGRRIDPVWGQFLDGWIDDLKVVSREMSHEEIKATWARLIKHQPDGVTALLGQAPPGAVFARADGSDVGRLVKAAGQAVGYATGKAHELRETFLPSTAYKDTIGRWESMVGLQQREQLALDTRRSRAVSRLQVENGYSPPKVQAILASPFAVAAADVNIIEFSPDIADTFTALNDERWRAEPAAAWTIVANEVQLQVLSGDMRFDPAGALNPYHLRMPIDNEDGLIVQAKLSTYWLALPTDVIVGLFLYNRATNDALWFGIKNVSSVPSRQLGWVALKNGVLGAFNALVNPSTDAAYYLRITRTASGNYLLYWSTVDFIAGTSAPVIGSITNVQDVGLAAMGPTNPTGSTLTATFDDFLARIPKGKRAFHWYAWRDPVDPGSPDMEAADRIVQTVKPAHTTAAAVLSLSLLCDNDTGLCDHTPLGGV